MQGLCGNISNATALCYWNNHVETECHQRIDGGGGKGKLLVVWRRDRVCTQIRAAAQVGVEMSCRVGRKPVQSTSTFSELFLYLKNILAASVSTMSMQTVSLCMLMFMDQILMLKCVKSQCSPLVWDLFRLCKTTRQSRHFTPKAFCSPN